MSERCHGMLIFPYQHVSNLLLRIFQSYWEAELIEDEIFSTNEERLKNVNVFDEIIGEWFRCREMEEVVNVLNENVGLMCDESQIYKDPHYNIEKKLMIKIWEK